MQGLVDNLLGFCLLSFVYFGGVMEIVDMSLSEVKLIRLRSFQDERGFFRESYRENLYSSHGIAGSFVQDNHSFSFKGTIRGMHFQAHPGQAKLVSVVSGRIFDAVVDIRPYSPTFGKWLGVDLYAENGEQLYIPVGFAHGFCVLSESAHVIYKVSNYYDPLLERTFRFDDAEVGIQWPVESPVLSLRDRDSPSFREVCA